MTDQNENGKKQDQKAVLIAALVILPATMFMFVLSIFFVVMLYPMITYLCVEWGVEPACVLIPGFY